MIYYGPYVEEVFCRICNTRYEKSYVTVCSKCGETSYRFASVGRWAWSWKHFWKRVWVARGHEEDNPYRSLNT